MPQNRPTHSAKQSAIGTLLPMPVPSDPVAKTMLVMLRRMAVHGLRDAHASQIAFGSFGTRFTEVLALTRCLLHETAMASARTIQIASCCTPRMTRDEALMIEVVMRGDKQALAALTENDRPTRALTAAFALSDILKA
ncbi:MAG: DUF6628 family protein [Marinomonas sp.]